MVDFKQKYLWFIIRSQHFDSPETLTQFTEHSKEIANAYYNTPISLNLIFKPTRKGKL